jgi:transcriptional regulator with XRE-family HTH domain
MVMNETIKEIIAANVKALRGDESQAKLANRAGVSQRAISNLERGEQSPTIETIDRLAAALRVPAWALMIRFDDVQTLRDAGLPQVIAAYARTPKDGRDQIKRIADAELRYAESREPKKPSPI